MVSILHPDAAVGTPVTRSRPAEAPPPVNPDGRYIVVRGRLWRAANPNLLTERRATLVGDLMEARRAVGEAKRSHDAMAENAAHAAVERAKVALGERGPSWWDDGAPDLNRRIAKNTPYAEWYSAIVAHRADSYCLP